MRLEHSYDNGRLEVGDGHTLYYEKWGNEDKDPILFLHGGPGGGFWEGQEKLFNPDSHHVIFYDQRGASDSTPFATLENNTTDDLVGDINKIMQELGIEKTSLVGGSWGSTLALTYAIRNTERVDSMLIWGTFLGDRESMDFFLRGEGTKSYRPEAWERLESHVPGGEDIMEYYFDKMVNGSEEEKEKYTYEHSLYESVISSFEPDIEEIKKRFEEKDYYKALAPIEMHYMVNDCFLPEGYIMENADKLSDVPTTIVHGRYDIVCQPKASYELSKRIENSKLVFVKGGHSSSEEAMQEAIKEEIMERFG